MGTVEDAFSSTPEEFYTHNEDRGVTVHRSARESIRREVIALQVGDGARVLEIGTGSGYSGAILAALAGPRGNVVSVDVSEHLAGWANLLHDRRGVTTVDGRVGDGMAGYPPRAPYDRIVAWCTPPRLPRAWVAQLGAGGRIVACLPVAAQPSTTLVTAITLDAGTPRVESAVFGGYAQSSPAAVEDALTVPGRWVDWSTRGPHPSWISIGWRDSDDRLRTGARTALDRLLDPGHVEVYGGEVSNWHSWSIFTAVIGNRSRTIVSLNGAARGVGHCTPNSVAVLLTDGTIIADRPASPSLAALHIWLERWQSAGRPSVDSYVPTLAPFNGTDLPGWDLRLNPRSTCLGGEDDPARG